MKSTKNVWFTVFPLSPLSSGPYRFHIYGSKPVGDDSWMPQLACPFEMLSTNGFPPSHRDSGEDGYFDSVVFCPSCDTAITMPKSRDRRMPSWRYRTRHHFVSFKLDEVFLSFLPFFKYRPGLTCLFFTFSEGPGPTGDSVAATEKPKCEVNNAKPKPEVNYAALSAGANILVTSLHMIGGSNLLQDHKDKYARSPCDQPKWVVINLSEDVRDFMG